jgi:hypothetical protein
MKDMSKLFLNIPKDVVWVALDRDQRKVIACGMEWDEVIQKAKAAGEDFPSMCRMQESPDTVSNR